MNTLEKYIQPLQDKVEKLQKELDDFRASVDLEGMRKAYETTYSLEYKINACKKHISEWVQKNEINEIQFVADNNHQSIVIDAKGFRAKIDNLEIDGDHDELSIQTYYLSEEDSGSGRDQLAFQFKINKIYPELSLKIEFREDEEKNTLSDFKNKLDVIRYLSRGEISIEDYMAN